MARAYLERNQPGDANSAFEVAEDGLRAYPDDPELLWYAAVGHAGNKNWDQATDRIDRFLALEPQNMRALYLGFAVAQGAGNWEKAEVYLLRAESVDSGAPLVEQMREALRSR